MPMLVGLLLILTPLACAILITLACVGIPRRPKPSELEQTLTYMEKGK